MSRVVILMLNAPFFVFSLHLELRSVQWSLQNKKLWKNVDVCLTKQNRTTLTEHTYVSSEWKKVAKEVGCNGENFIYTLHFLSVCPSVSLYV